MKMIERVNCVSVRLSEKEKQRIQERAASLGLNLSEFLRRRSLEKQIVPETDLQRLRELRQLGRELKQNLLETRETYSQGMADAISAVESYARGQAENFKR
jgi:hypothetical protein